MRSSGMQRPYRLALLIVVLLAALPVASVNVLPASASTNSRHLPSPGTRPAWLRCQPISSGTGTAERCAGFHEIQPSQLSPADQSRRRSALARIASRSQSETGPRSKAVPASLGDPPSQCFAGPDGLSANPDRFTSCGDTPFELDDILISDDGTETITGTFTFDDLQWISFSGTSLTWTHGMITNTFTGTGDLAGGFDAEVSSECSLAGSICAALSQTDPDPQSVAITDNSSYDFEWLESDGGSASNSIGGEDFMEGFLAAAWTADTPDGGFAEAVDGGDLAGRCDSVITTSNGCVDEVFVPIVLYDSTSNPNIEPVAKHVFDTQNGGLTMAWGADPNVVANGEYLTRNMSEADNDANRQAACGDVSVPTGDSCDEFPLASTYQGAFFNSDFSTAIVPQSANDSQGGIMSSFYGSNRVVDGDQFLVLAVLDDGTPSW